MGDESLHGDLLFDLQEEALTAQHHALQDVQAHLLYGGVGRFGVDEARDLKRHRVINVRAERGGEERRG